MENLEATKRLSWATSDKPSRVTVPERANPLAKLVFAEMRRQRVTYAELEHRANVLVSTFKAWRCEKNPGLVTIEAALGALGWALVPVPRNVDLPADAADALERLGEHFRSDQEAYGYAVRAAAEWPGHAKQKWGEATLRRTGRPPLNAPASEAVE
jgi:hypothetical protein